MKNLKITYGDTVLWDAPVGSLEWHDSDNGVKVDGRIKPKPAGNGAGGLLEMLTKASKTRTSQVADEKRESYEAETVEPELVEGAV